MSGPCREPLCRRFGLARSQACGGHKSLAAGRLLTIGGVTDTVGGWARRAGMSRQTLHGRLRRGWEAERAIQKPEPKKRAA